MEKRHFETDGASAARGGQSGGAADQQSPGDGAERGQDQQVNPDMDSEAGGECR